MVWNPDNSLRTSLDSVINGADLHVQIPQLQIQFQVEFKRFRHFQPELAIRYCHELLQRVNQLTLPLLERQRVMELLEKEFTHYVNHCFTQEKFPHDLALFCQEMADGYRHLLMHVIESKNTSRPYLIWCLYMSLYHLVLCMILHYHLYKSPPAGTWLSIHLVYWMSEKHQCLDHVVSVTSNLKHANTIRGLYQQALMVGISNPFHLAEFEAIKLFGFLANYALDCQIIDPSSRQRPAQDPIFIDLQSDEPRIPPYRQAESIPDNVRKLDLDPLLIKLYDHFSIPNVEARNLLVKARDHWLNRSIRKFERQDVHLSCGLITGLNKMHAFSLNRQTHIIYGVSVNLSEGGASIQCDKTSVFSLTVGQILLIRISNETKLAMVKWRHETDKGLKVGVRYFGSDIQPVWIRRTPTSLPHPGILQNANDHATSPPQLWLLHGQFVKGEDIWLQGHISEQQIPIRLVSAGIENHLVVRFTIKSN